MKGRGQLFWGIVVQILAISCWFNTAAVAPAISVEFELDAGEVIGLTAAVQGGFAIGALVLGILRAADRVRPNILITLGSLSTALFTITPIVIEHDLVGFILTRLCVGFSLAAVYPTGMRVVLSWATVKWRGLAVAGLVAALTLGTAAPHLLAASAFGAWRQVLVLTAVLAVGAAAIGFWSKTGPHVAPVGAVSLGQAVAVMRDRIQRRISIAYVGHMWEVYGMWVWLPTLIATLPAIGALAHDRSLTVMGTLTFLLIGVAGAIGCFVVGLLPGLVNKRALARSVTALSGVCVLLTPWLAGMPLWLALVVLAVWSAAAIGDSAMYSAMTGDESGQAAVGTAITIQMSIGYALSVGAFCALPLFASFVGWQWAFLVLAAGPVVGFFAMRPWTRPSPIAGS